MNTTPESIDILNILIKKIASSHPITYWQQVLKPLLSADRRLIRTEPQNT